MNVRHTVYLEYLKKELPRQGIKFLKDRWAFDKKIVLYEATYREDDTYKRFLVTNHYTRHHFYYLVPKYVDKEH